MRKHGPRGRVRQKLREADNRIIEEAWSERRSAKVTKLTRQQTVEWVMIDRRMSEQAWSERRHVTEAKLTQ